MTTKLNDVTLRDGHQSLLAGRMKQEDLLAAAPHLARAGFARMEVWGGTAFDVPIRFKNENPFTNIKQLRDVIHASAADAGKTAPKLAMLLRGRNLVGYRPYNAGIIDAFVQQAASSGVQVFRIFDALNDIENVKDAIAQAVKLRDKDPEIEVEGTLCYTKIDAEDLATHPELAGVHSTQAYVAYAKKLKALGCTSICIKDMAGMMAPEDVAPLVSALKNEVGLPIVLHTHSAMGLSNATIAEAVRCGIDQVDTAAEALSGGCGQSASADILALGGDVAPVDTAAIDAANAELRQRRGKYSAFEIPYFKGLEERLRKSQVPGGMVTTFWEQIDTQFASLYKSKGYQLDSNARAELLYAILDEVRQVRADAGYVSLVTPSSQYAGSQAVMNVLEFVKDAFDQHCKPNAARKAELRYKNISTDFAGMVVEVADRVANRPDGLCAQPSAALLEKARLVAEKKAPIDPRNLGYFEQAVSGYGREGDSLDALRENALIYALGGETGEQFLKVQAGQLAADANPNFAKFEAAMAKGESFTATRIIDPGLVAQATDVLETYVQATLRAQRMKDDAVLGGDVVVAKAVQEAAKKAVDDFLRSDTDLGSAERSTFAQEVSQYLTLRGKVLGVDTREIKLPWSLAHPKPDGHWLDVITRESGTPALAV